MDEKLDGSLPWDRQGDSRAAVERSVGPSTDDAAPSLRDSLITALAGSREGHPGWAEAVCGDPAIDRSDDPVVQYLGGLIAGEIDDAKVAITRLRRCVYVDRDFLPAYLAIWAIHEREGDLERGGQARAQVERLMRSPAGRRHLEWVSHASAQEVERLEYLKQGSLPGAHQTARR